MYLAVPFGLVSAAALIGQPEHASSNIVALANATASEATLVEATCPAGARDQTASHQASEGSSSFSAWLTSLLHFGPYDVCWSVEGPPVDLSTER